jgi:hypothetical protein
LELLSNKNGFFEKKIEFSKKAINEFKQLIVNPSKIVITSNKNIKDLNRDDVDLDLNYKKLFLSIAKNKKIIDKVNMYDESTKHLFNLIFQEIIENDLKIIDKIFEYINSFEIKNSELTIYFLTQKEHEELYETEESIDGFSSTLQDFIQDVEEILIPKIINHYKLFNQFNFLSIHK